MEIAKYIKAVLRVLRETGVAINTLNETLMSREKNDVSFLLDEKLVVVMEHQSTMSKNMPFRCLQYIGHLFENTLTSKQALYQTTRITLPRPEFIVLYNGIRSYPDHGTLRISDAYEIIEGYDAIFLELEVMVYNVNENHNREIMNRSEDLRGYAFFVHRVRLHETALKRQGAGTDRDRTIRAIRQAIQDCKRQELLLEYWSKLTTEEINIIGAEWDNNIAKEVAREEGREEGREERDREIARKMKNAGKPLSEIIEFTGLSIEIIDRL